MVGAPAPHQSTTVSRCITAHKNHGQKKPGKRRSDGVLCLDKPVLTKSREGGGYIYNPYFTMHNTPQPNTYAGHGTA